MKLIIKDTDWEHTIYGLTLDKGITPALNILTDEQMQSFHIPDIESAVWFKILVINSVTIDLPNRSVTWLSSKQPPQTDIPHENGLLRNKKRVKRISESTYLLSDEAQQTCTDLDEVFEETRTIIQRFRTSEHDANVQLRFYQDMFSVLHRNVLPSITLSKEDVPQLEAAHEFYQTLIKKQNDLICAGDVRREHVSKSQRNLRDKYYEEISQKKDGSSLSLPCEVAMLLYNHVQEDLSHFSQKLTETQTDVNLGKHTIGQFRSKQTDTTDHDDEIHIDTGDDASNVERSDESELSQLKSSLLALREKRNKVFERYKYLLHIRETLGEYVSDRVVLSRSKSSKKMSKRHIIRSKLKKISKSSKSKLDDPRDNIYVQLERELEDKLRQTTLLVEEKVQMISVKEGIKSAIDELKTENIAFGVDFDFAGSFRATDVKKRPTLPDNWLSLNERISLSLENTSSNVYKIHVSGCQRVIMQCTMFNKLHRKYLLSDPDTCDSLSIDSNQISIDSHNIDTVFEPSRLSVCSSLSSLSSSAENGIRLNTVRTHTDTSKKSDNAEVHYRDSTVHAEKDTGGLGSLLCVGARNVECAKAYTNERRQRYNSLVALEDSSADLGDLVIVHDTSPEYAHKTVDKIRHDIKAHMGQICMELQKSLDKPSRTDYQRIWSSYERIYFTEIMPSLEKLYAVAYADVIAGLEESLPKLTPYTLAMDNQVILQLFEDIQPPQEMKRIEEETIDIPVKVDSANMTKLMDGCPVIKGEHVAQGESMQKSKNTEPHADQNVNTPSNDTEPTNAEKFDANTHHLALSETTDTDKHDEPITLQTNQRRNSSFQNENSSEELSGDIKPSISNALSESPSETNHDSFQNNPDASPNTSVELRRSGVTKEEKRQRAFNRSKVFSAPAMHSGPEETRLLCPDALAAQVSTHMGFIEEDPSSRDKSGSDVNMNLAEQLIQNSTSGHLQREAMRATSSKPTSSKDVMSPASSQSTQTSSKPSDIDAHSMSTERNAPMAYFRSESHASEYSADLDTTLNSTLDESFASITTCNRSKYANVLDKINIDYARQVEKNIHVYYPTSVNFWQQETRNTWPLVGEKEGIEFASEAMVAQQASKDIEESTSFTSRGTLKGSNVSIFSHMTSSPEMMHILTSKSVHIQKPYLDQLDGVVKQLQALCHESTPTTKLQYAFKALHELGIQVKGFHTKLGGRSSQFAAPSADDLTDFLVVLLCNCDMNLVKSLYINVQIMRDHIPENLETGPYGFALMQLTICLHFLQERIVMQRGLMDNDAARLSFTL